MNPIEEKDLLEVARKVLTGELPRDQIVTLPDPRLIACAAAVMVLALRREIDGFNQLKTDDFGSVLRDVVLRGKALCDFHSDVISSEEIWETIVEMELLSLGVDNLTLRASGALEALIKEHRAHPAITAFRDDMEAGIAHHEGWLQERFDEAAAWRAAKATQEMIV